MVARLNVCEVHCIHTTFELKWTQSNKSLELKKIYIYQRVNSHQVLE